MNFERYLGLPWKTGGREVSTGVDCWGLFRLFYLCELGIAVTEFAVNPGHLADAVEVAASELDGRTWIETPEPAPGDAVALGTHGRYSHVGVYCPVKGSPGLLHIRAKQTACVVPVRRLMEESGFTEVAYYRHVANSHR